VAQACPPQAGAVRCLPRLPCGSGDVVALLPGPRDLHAPDLLAEARRLMTQGGYLAVAWNDRWAVSIEERVMCADWGGGAGGSLQELGA
jgi:hypothetical protein